jgi:dolichol-phosphate mannosyltransferase
LNTAIIIPTYQERANIVAFLGSLMAAVPHARILVVDDNSPDGTAEAVREIPAQCLNIDLMLRSEKNGLGKAYADGFARVLDTGWADTVVMMDADFSHDPQFLPAMLDAAKSHELVVGSRYIPGAGVDGWEPWRVLLSSIGNRYARSITRMPVHDLTSGFNVIHCDLIREIDCASFIASGYAFQIELKYRLWLAGASVAEYPIIFRERRGGESKLTNHIIAEGALAPWRLRFGCEVKRAPARENSHLVLTG